MTILTLLLQLLLLLALPAPARAYAAPELLFRFQDAAIVESSGVATSSRSDAVLYTHNDSGDSQRFFAVGPSGQTLATITVRGAVAIDWEDMARGPGAAGPALYLADIGDNQRVRPVVTVYEVPEPEVDDAAAGAALEVEARAHLLAYEDGPHNAETLLVHPTTGAIAIVTKETNGSSGVYVADAALAAGAPRLLRRVATIDLRSVRQVPLPAALLATGGDISPDGSRFVVRTYYEAFEWSLGPGGFAPAIGTAPAVTRLASVSGGEAITYSSDGTALLDTAEGFRAPVHRYAAS